MTSPPRMRTIAQCATMLKDADPDTAFTANALRSMVLSGRIPCVKAGTKRLINYDKLLEALECLPKRENTPTGYGSIRRVG